MIVYQQIELDAYPHRVRTTILETFFEAQVRVNMIFLRTHPHVPNLYDAGVRYRREGSPERWKDVPTILRDGFDDCEGLSCWLAAEHRERRGIRSARVGLVRQHDPHLLHAIVVDDENPLRKWDPSRVLGMGSKRTRKAA